MTADGNASDRERLIRLLRRLLDKDDSVDDNEILEIVHRQLHQALRPMLLSQHGPRVGEASVSTRFTELLNEFFVKVLQSFPPGMENLCTWRALCNYVAKAMHHMVLDSFSKNRLAQRYADTLMNELIEERRQMFRTDCPTVPYERALEVLKTWENSDGVRRRWAQLIRYRYVLGEEQSRVQELLGLTKHAYYKLQAAAIDTLRCEIQS